MRSVFELPSFIVTLAISLLSSLVIGPVNAEDGSDARGNLVKPKLYVVATQSVPKAERMLDGVHEQLGHLVDIIVHDLRGRPANNAHLVERVKSQIVPGDVVMTIGGPAAKLYLQGPLTNSVLCTMTSPASHVNNPELVKYSNSDATLDEMSDVLQMLWPQSTNIAVLVSPKMKSEYLARAEDYSGITLVEVTKTNKLSTVLDSIKTEFDGFIFPRDKGVLNRRSISEAVEWLEDNRKPAVGYSKFLVSAGFPAAVAVDDKRMNADVVSSLRELITGTHQVDNSHKPLIWLNSRIASDVAKDWSTTAAEVKVL